MKTITTVKDVIEKLIDENSFKLPYDERYYFKDNSYLIDDIGVTNLSGNYFYKTSNGIILKNKNFYHCQLNDTQIENLSTNKNNAFICLKMGEGINLICNDWF